MNSFLDCPRCGISKSWNIRRGKRRCSDCRYEWKPGQRPLQLSDSQWEGVIKRFLIGLSADRISLETALERRRTLRAISKIREIMRKQFSDPETEAVEGAGVSHKTPTIGIHINEERISAELISAADREKWLRYAGVIHEDKLHQPTRVEETASSREAQLRTTNLFTFWNFLKRRLSVKRGIRPHRLPFYLAEYTWRFNHRHLSRHQQQRQIMSLLIKRFEGSGRLPN